MHFLVFTMDHDEKKTTLIVIDKNHQKAQKEEGG